jgi:hypothetical protein
MYDDEKEAKAGQITSPGTMKDGKYDFTFVNPTFKDQFKIYPKITVNGGSVISDIPIDIKFICGLGSTSIEGPEILPNSDTGDSHVMIFPDVSYTLKSFISSNKACPVKEIEIAPIEKGTDEDYTSSDGISKVRI